MPRGAAWHTASVLSIWGRSALCFSKDGGASWSTVPIYRPGLSSYAGENGDCGNMAAARALTNSGATISLLVTPSKLSTANTLIVYPATVTLATGAVTMGSAVTVADGSSAFSSYTMYIVLPANSPTTALGFMLDSVTLWVTANGGGSWSNAGGGLSSPAYATQPACPQGAAGYCYTTVSHTTIYRAAAPFTTWTQRPVTLPAAPAGCSAWTMGTGYRAMECARVAGADEAGGPCCATGLRVARAPGF